MAEPWHLVWAGLGGVVFSVLVVRMRWLTAPGSAFAWIIGMATAWRFGWVGLAALMVTFVVTTLASKLPGRHRSGARSLRQVVANGACPLAGALVSLVDADLGLVVFLAGFGFLGSDTLASELGVRYGGTPRRLLRREPLAPGQSGGVTWLGMGMSLVGAWLPLLAYLPTRGVSLPVASVAAASAFLGAIVDSVLGDTLQYRGLSPETGTITERRTVNGVATEHHSGLRWLDNDGVNLVSGLAAGAIALLFTILS